MLTNNLDGYQVTVRALGDELLPTDPEVNPGRIPISELLVHNGTVGTPYRSLTTEPQAA